MKRSTNIKLALGVLVAGFAACAFIAIDAPGRRPENHSAGLQPLVAAGFHIIASAPAAGGEPAGTRVYVVQSGAEGGYQLAYRLPNGHIILGEPLNDKGEPVAAATIRRLALPMPLSKVYKGLMSSPYTVTTGLPIARRSMVVIGDPDCYYTHVLWEQIHRAVGAGRLQVYWNFAPIVGAHSMERSAAIILAMDPGSMLDADEKHFHVQSERGGVKPMPAGSVPSALKAAINRNLELLHQLGTNGTPTVIYRAPNGDLRVMGGLPSAQVMEWLTSEKKIKPEGQPQSSQRCS